MLARVGKSMLGEFEVWCHLNPDLAPSWFKNNKERKMRASEYQNATRGFAVYPEENEFAYLTLGLAAEAGEVADKAAKYFRGDDNRDAAEFRKELGDCMWFISQLCNRFGWQLEDVMQENINKLADRQARNKLKGSGDNR